MPFPPFRLSGRLLTALVLALLCGPLRGVAQVPLDTPYAPFVPTPDAVVDEMLELARVSARDVVYDLGSGDGRIVIAAASRFGAKGVGIEIDADLVRDANERAEQAGVAHLVRFQQGDFFAVDLREATVVTLYLLPEVNRQLLPKLLAELRPGTRIVSRNYGLGDWPAEKIVQASRGTLYYWVVPTRTGRGE